MGRPRDGRWEVGTGQRPNPWKEEEEYYDDDDDDDDKINVKFNLEQVMETQRGSRVIALLFLLPRR